LANFNEAYNITLKHEGGYVNDPTDVGGETYKGVSRRYHPSWSGWTIVDGYKNKPGFPNSAYGDKQLEEMVKSFYKSNFWDVNILDQFKSQNIADEMFDTGVNMGTFRAATFLQRALNVLNNNGKVYENVVEDGKIGPRTIKAVDSCIAYRGDAYLFKVMNILQGMHYIEFMNKSPIQQRFAYGWFNRVTFLK
jgi:lysozyme family protein